VNHPAPSPSDNRPSWWRRLSRSSDDTRPGFSDTCEPATTQDLLDVAVASLHRCGFEVGDFSLRVLRHRTDEPWLLVELHRPERLAWELAGHLETYLVDRIHRHSGLTVERIVFTPRRPLALDLVQAREGVRKVWSRLTAPQGLDSGPDASNPHLASGAHRVG